MINHTRLIVIRVELPGLCWPFSRAVSAIVWIALLDLAATLTIDSIYIPSHLAIVLMCFIVCVASIVQASLGMGYGLTAAPLLALVDPAFVPVPTILVGLFTSSMGAWSERSNIIWSDVKLASAGRLAGALLAALILSVITDTSGFMIVFGVGVAAAVLLSVFDHTLIKSPASLSCMGAVSGLMGTITGVGAPPLALIYHRSYAGNARPTLAAIFAVGCAASALILAFIGWLGKSEIVLFAMMLPPMLAGTLIGRGSRRFIDRKFRAALLLVSGIAAIMLVIKGFWGGT